MQTQTRRFCHGLRRGFTLVELMIVVAMIAIMVALAMPSYESHVRKARRIDARNALLDLALRQEKHFSIHNRYSTAAADLGYPALPHAVTHSGSASFYTLTLTGDGRSYSAKATPTGPQARDTQCYAYTIAQSGLRGNLDAANASLASGPCW